MVSCKITGWVEKLYVDYTGRSVGFGARLLEIYSPDLVSAQEEYLQAFRAAMEQLGVRGRDWLPCLFQHARGISRDTCLGQCAFASAKRAA